MKGTRQRRPRASARGGFTCVACRGRFGAAAPRVVIGGLARCVDCTYRLEHGDAAANRYQPPRPGPAEPEPPLFDATPYIESKAARARRLAEAANAGTPPVGP